MSHSHGFPIPTAFHVTQLATNRSAQQMNLHSYLKRKWSKYKETRLSYSSGERSTLPESQRARRHPWKSGNLLLHPISGDSVTWLSRVGPCQLSPLTKAPGCPDGGLETRIILLCPLLLWLFPFDRKFHLVKEKQRKGNSYKILLRANQSKQVCSLSLHFNKANFSNHILCSKF